MGHALEDTIISRMQNILRVANRLKEVTAVSNSPTYSPLRTSRPPVTIDLINLPSPPPLLASLLEAGLTHEIAGAASEVYQLRSDELRRHVQESIMTACHKIAELPTVALASSADSCIRSVVSSFTQVYLHRLEQWKEEVIRRIKQAPKPLSNAVPRESRTFNHVSTSIVQSRLFLTHLAEICSIVGALFRRKPFPDACRQDIPR